MADCKWADLTEWIASLCAADSTNLPAALWLVSTCTPPAEHFQSQGADWNLEAEMIALFDHLIGLCAAVNAKARELPSGGSGTWRGLGNTVKRLFHHFPEYFRFSLLICCAMGKEFGEGYEPAEPEAAELEALLEELDLRQPYLLPGVLEMMANHPSAGALAARWRPPERPQAELILRKLLLFVREVKHLIQKDGGRESQLWKDVGELFLEAPEVLLKLDPDTPEPPLETWLEVEGIIDDACVKIPGKVFQICQLLTSQPVCN